MGIRDFHNSIRDKLRLSTRIVNVPGAHLEENEKFDIQCTLTNTAQSHTHLSDPNIVFTNPHIVVRGAKFASPVGGGKTVQLPDDRLHSGESSSTTVEYQVDKEFPGIREYMPGAEDLADIYGMADLDQDLLWNNFFVHEDVKLHVGPR